MRVLQVSEDHGRYVATLAETDLPAPRPGEALVRVAASGVNRADLSQIAGHYPPPPGESEILGLEVSGTIAETGAPVCALLAGGGHAEDAAVPEAFPPAWVTRARGGGRGGEGGVRPPGGGGGGGRAGVGAARAWGSGGGAPPRTAEKLPALTAAGADLAVDAGREDAAAAIERQWGRIRSEEHTSELQSQSNLVCRLLLEKKKDNKTT